MAREGCAEHFATKTGAARGFVDEGERRSSMVVLAQEGGEFLASLETAGGATFTGGSGGAYTAGYLACERLSATRGADKAMRQFWVSLATLRSWERAFADAFGVWPGAFYAEFGAYRLTL